MLSGNWLRKRFSRNDQGGQHRPLTKGRRRKEVLRDRSLRVETLEDRRMLATYVVNTLGDLDTDGNVIPGSLRNAVELSNASGGETDTIVFADFLFNEQGVGSPSTILLDGRENGQQLSITDEVNILGPGPGALQIVAAPRSRIFNIDIDALNQVRPVFIGGMTLTGGNVPGQNAVADWGGAIFNNEGLTLVETHFFANSAAQGGGAIYNFAGNLSVDRSLFEGNSSGAGGGAIHSGWDLQRATTTVTNSTFYNNSTTGVVRAGVLDPGYGGGVYNENGVTTITHSTFMSNSASAGGGGVATRGEVFATAENPPPPTVTSLSHSVLFGNLGPGGADDVFEVRRQEITGFLMGPTLLIDGPGRGYNFIGQIGGTVFWDPADGGNGHFYQAIATPEETPISWTDANRLTTFGHPGREPDQPLPGAHLATPSTPEENTFLFDMIVNNPALWSTFQPEDVGDPAMTPPEESIGPWFGALQTDTSAEPDDGWEFVTAAGETMPQEVFATPTNPPDPTLTPNPYNNWLITPADPLTPVQPNDGVRPMADPDDEIVRENFAHYFGDAGPADTWGDGANEPDGDGASPIAFVIEYDQGTNFFGTDPLLSPVLVDAGGSTMVFHPVAGSPLIDAGVSPSVTPFEQRGRHFARVAGLAPDIGAVEAQQGNFVVDSLEDEDDRQYSPVYRLLDPTLQAFVFPGYDQSGGAILGTPFFYSGDFTLREALDFAEKNPGPDIINFETAFPKLLTRLDDPTFSPAPTIELDLTTIARGLVPVSDPKTALTIASDVTIIGPSDFVLEIDASGNDPTPDVQDNLGTRVFSVNDFNASTNLNVSINNLTILGGDVTNRGGGILNSENLTITNSTIKDNAASSDGGGIFTQFGNLTINSSTLHDNSSGSTGGGLFVDSKFVLNPAPINVVVRNSTISGNSAGLQGAGVYNGDGNVLIEYSTITENIAPIGAGVASFPGPDAFTQVRSSIIAGNLGDDVTLLPGATNIQSLGFNLIGDGNVSVIFTGLGDQFGETDPKLGPLVNTGGLVPTHRLLPGSPAIDAGDISLAAGVGNTPLNDQRGAPFGRIFDGLQDGKAFIDIGAYELQGSTFIVDNLIDENDGNISLGNFSLREAIEASNLNPFVDTITFDPSLVAAGQATIQQTPRNDPFLLLRGGTPTDIRITDSVNIIGLGSSLLFLDGTAGYVDFLDQFEMNPPNPLPRTRFFTIDDGDGTKRLEVNISDLTFTNSVNTEDHGGALKSTENLTLSNVEFIENSTLGNGLLGGGVYQEGGELVLDGVRFSANSTTGVGSRGAAVYVSDVDLDVMNGSQFVGNVTFVTDSGGAAIFANNSDVTFDGSFATSNVTAAGDSQGAGIYAANSTLMVTDSIISANRTSGAQSRGAGIYGKDSSVTIQDSTIVSNRTLGTFASGAGAFSTGGSLTVQDSLFSTNITSGAGSGGAAIAGDNAELLVERSTLRDGITTGSNAPGGAIRALDSNLTVRDSTISGNSATGLNGSGGGVYSSANLGGPKKSTISNSTISGNSAGLQGGGIFNASGLTEIKYSTITDNSIVSAVPAGFGSGVASFGGANVRTEVRSTIIAGNNSTDVDNPGGVFNNSFVSLGYNLIGNGLSSSTFNAPGDIPNVLDPRLEPLANNGGATLTHALMDDSLALEAGDPSAISGVGGVPALDQRGLPRVQENIIDIGAYEATAAADFNADGFVNGLDFFAWQRGFGSVPADKSDGDANDDNLSNSDDLNVWAMSYGNPQPLSGLAAAVSVTTEEAALPAPLTVETNVSEPVVASAVRSSIDELRGLTATTIVVNRDGATPSAARDLAVESATASIDQSFNGYQRLADDDNELDAVYQAVGDSADEELDVTVEDRVFDLIGS